MCKYLSVRNISPNERAISVLTPNDFGSHTLLNEVDLLYLDHPPRLLSPELIIRYLPPQPYCTPLALTLQIVVVGISPMVQNLYF